MIRLYQKHEYYNGKTFENTDEKLFVPERGKIMFDSSNPYLFEEKKFRLPENI